MFKYWLNSTDILKGLSPYDTVEFGVTWVNPKDIIALSLPAKKIKKDVKMKRLINYVKQNGWNDPYPYLLHLYRIPKGKYIVGCGGNHRTYLSNRLGIKKIQAKVTIILHSKKIPESIKSDVEYYLLKSDQWAKKGSILNDWLNEQTFRHDYPEEEKKTGDLLCTGR